MSEPTITPGQIGELDKKLRLAGIKDHQALQGLLDNKERFAQFVALLEGREENASLPFMPQKSFLERLTQRTQAGEIEWIDCGECQVEYSKHTYAFFERTFSTTIDGIQVLLVRRHGWVIMSVRNHESFKLKIEKGEKSAVLEDTGGLLTRKPIRNLYKRVERAFCEQSRRDSQKKKTENQETASALSQELLELTAHPG